MLFFCSIRWKNVKGYRRILKRKVTENKRSGRPWYLLTKSASGHSAVIFCCCTRTQLKCPGKGLFNTTLSTVSGYYLLTILWRLYLCSSPPSPLLCARHIPRGTTLGHVQKLQFAPGGLQTLLGLPSALPVCAWGSWRVSQALSAQLLACALLGVWGSCGAASLPAGLFWAIFHLSPVPTGTGPVLECPWTWSFLLWSNDAFYHRLQTVGSEALF